MTPAARRSRNGAGTGIPCGAAPARCRTGSRRARGAGSVWDALRRIGYRGRRDEVCAAVLAAADMAGINVEASIRSADGGEGCPARDSPGRGRSRERAVVLLVGRLAEEGRLDAIRPQ